MVCLVDCYYAFHPLAVYLITLIVNICRCNLSMFRLLVLCAKSDFLKCAQFESSSGTFHLWNSSWAYCYSKCKLSSRKTLKFLAAVVTCILMCIGLKVYLPEWWSKFNNHQLLQTFVNLFFLFTSLEFFFFFVFQLLSSYFLVFWHLIKCTFTFT